MPPGQINSQAQEPTQVCRWHPVADLHALEAAAVAWILAAATAAIEARQQFHLVLSGGDTPRGVYQQLRHANTDWLRWHLYFSDERCLLPDDGGRNSNMAADAWLDHVSIPTSHIHFIPAELGATRAAQAYAAALRSTGDFDLVLLGLGEDGHTASLFPAHDWGSSTPPPLQGGGRGGDGVSRQTSTADSSPAQPHLPPVLPLERGGTLDPAPLPNSNGFPQAQTELADVLAIHDAPKPPAERVSLSAARLSRARQVLFLVGTGKQNALADWQAGKDIPARRIAPPGGVDVLYVAGACSP